MRSCACLGAPARPAMACRDLCARLALTGAIAATTGVHTVHHYAPLAGRSRLSTRGYDCPLVVRCGHMPCPCLPL